MKMSTGDVDLYRVLHVDPNAHPTVVQAAYRALARMFHPDRTATSGSIEMVLINRAYAVLRDPEQRRAYDRRWNRAAPPPPTPAHAAAPVAPAPTSASTRSTTGVKGTALPHGRYAGWTLEQLVRHDPDYLRWLSRHTSGLRYRSEIARLLANADTKRAVAR